MRSNADAVDDAVQFNAVGCDRIQSYLFGYNQMLYNAVECDQMRFAVVWVIAAISKRIRPYSNGFVLFWI